MAKMTSERWSQITDAARQEELAIRKLGFDAARPPLMTAVNIRLMVGLWERVENLEEALGVGMKLIKECPECGLPIAYTLEGGSPNGCLPGHCAVAEGRLSPQDAAKERARLEEMVKAAKKVKAS